MRITERTLYASGLPACWQAGYQALRGTPALHAAVRHTTESLNRMPAGYRLGTAAALRTFPIAFRAVTGRPPRAASPEEAVAGLGRLRGLPGYGQLLRATTALALYGALDSAPGRAEALR
ncbi:hypothetical protein [Streptomyces sp. NRRL S-350]|uniref:hypothetical protein n=1 Tax=Streptomyces sp. NRRL S-350 TaxID=1463902 RepID=UPI0004BF4F37|nr:hypothetical protein [Streptomyces sp. NRRL S-350]